jgi:hypothetical protein
MRSGEPNKLWNSILNQSSVEDNIEKIRLKKKQKKNSSQLGLTCQTHDSSHEMRITS